MQAKHAFHYLTVVPAKQKAVTLSIANANHIGLALQGYRGKVIPLSAFIKRLLVVFSSVLEVQAARHSNVFLIL